MQGEFLMAINLYDDAIYNKIQRWVRDPNMRILNPNETARLFRMRADQTNDEPLTLPIIAIGREPSIDVLTTGKRSLSADGKHVKSDEENTVQLNAIPIKLSYQIDIYTKECIECYEYVRNFTYNLVNHPRMSIFIPYNGAQIEHVCNLELESTITDNSDIAERRFSDEFTRWTITVSVNDAYLFSVPINKNARILETSVWVYDPRTGKSIPEKSDVDGD